MKRLAPIILLAASTPLLAVPSEALDSPEEVSAVVAKLLDRVEQNLGFVRHSIGRRGFSVKTQQADAAFAHGEAMYQQDHFFAAISALDQYIALYPKHDEVRFLRAQFLLASALQATGQDERAIAANLSYLRQFVVIDQPNYEELLTVCRHLLALAGKHEVLTNDQITPLLASIGTLNLPAQYRYEITFLLAKLASQIGLRRYASQWLSNIIAFNDSPELGARALYFQALLAIAVNKTDTAYHLLARAKKKKVDDPDLAALIALGLARLTLNDKNPEGALLLYDTIAESSPGFEAAQMESLFAFLQLQRYDQARTRAASYLGSFPESKRKGLVLEIMPYLDLLAGELEPAEAQLQENLDTLTALGKNLDLMIGRVFPKNTAQLREFHAQFDERFSAPPALIASLARLQETEDLDQKIQSLRGDLSNLYFNVGQLPLRELRPEWRHRLKQVEVLAKDTMGAGHLLIAMERGLYAQQLAPALRQELDSSAERRLALLSAKLSAKRERGQWQREAASWHAYLQLMDQENRLRDLAASLASANYLAHLRPGATQDEHQIRAAEEKLRHLRNELALKRQNIETMRLADQNQLTPIAAVAKLVSTYSLALNEEKSLLDPVRHNPSSLAYHYLSVEATRAWSRWEFASEQILSIMRSTEQEITASYRDFNATLQTHDQTLATLSRQKELLGKSVLAEIQRNFPEILAQYRGQVARLTSRYQKWQADVAWVRSMRIGEQRTREAEEFDLNKQRLEDHLRAIKAGVQWQWPE